MTSHPPMAKKSYDGVYKVVPMLHFFRSKKDPVPPLLEKILQRIDLRFSELSAQVKDLELSLKQMEQKLLTKDLRDRQQMGALHYRLESELGIKKNRQRDQ